MDNVIMPQAGRRLSQEGSVVVIDPNRKVHHKTGKAFDKSVSDQSLKNLLFEQI